MSLSEAERRGVRLDVVIGVLKAHGVSVTTIQTEVNGELWRFMQIAKDGQIEAQFLPAISFGRAGRSSGEILANSLASPVVDGSTPRA